jgi:hypothetical protein
VPRNAENDQQRNIGNDQTKGSAFHYLRRYQRRGRHLTPQESTTTPLLGGLLETVAAAGKSKINPIFSSAAKIAQDTRAKINPYVGSAADIAYVSKLKTNPVVGAVAATVTLGGVVFLASTIPASAAPDDTARAAVVTSAAPSDAADRLRLDETASRSRERANLQVDNSPAQRTPQAAPAPPKPAPVGGLGQTEMDNAIAIVEAGKQMNLPRRAYVVAIATALQESRLRVLANPSIPDSMNRPNQGVGYDHDSVGLFQQRPNWGSPDQLMDPQESARRFYDVLAKIPGWEQLPVTIAAQRVQVSAFPDAYAQHEGLANQIVDAILK